MRLLHTHTLTFEDFFDAELPEYCILSHRWGRGEVDYQAMLNGKANKGSQGYRKIIGCCNIARSLGFERIWIDTCCIDKSSSAELSEAINSMFQWYARAKVCIAYLGDVDLEVPPHINVEPGNLGPFEEAFCKSSWFNRGWTLQELLAPADLRFYSSDYTFLGTKSQLSQVVHDATGIDPEYLIGKRSIHEACVAERMSWAANRKTTRLEDKAYSLLGIFRVNMPLLYGEREDAFFRLQLAIMEKSDDETLFAWLPEPPVEESEIFGMLARSPEDFARSSQVRKVDLMLRNRPSYTFTNRGLKLRRFGGKINDEPFQFSLGALSGVIVGLACKNLAASQYLQTGFLGIILRRVGDSWYRARCDRFHYVSKYDRSPSIGSSPLHDFYVPQPDIRQRRLHTTQTTNGPLSPYSPLGVDVLSPRSRFNLRPLYSLAVVVAWNTYAGFPRMAPPVEASGETALMLFLTVTSEFCREYLTWSTWMQIHENWDLTIFIGVMLGHIGPLVPILQSALTFRGDAVALMCLSLGASYVLARLDQ